MMTVSEMLKTTGYGLLNAASHKGGGYCAAGIPSGTGSRGCLGRMYLPNPPKEPSPA